MKYVLLFISSLFPLSLSAQTLDAVESIEYDASQNRFIMSNGSSMLQRSSDGTISYFGTDSGTHGIEIFNGRMFVVQGTLVKGYDLVSENLVMSINISGAIFLNGLTTDGSNRLWATDFNGKKIYEIDITDINNPTYTQVATTSVTPNGILYDGTNNRLIFVSWGSMAAINALDLNDYSISTIINTPNGNLDGIDSDNSNNYFVSHWSPAGITKYDSDFTNPTTISVPGIYKPADICYAKEIDTLAIPDDGNTLFFVGFETTPVGDIIDGDYQFSMGPNPMVDQTLIQFNLESNEHIKLDIYNLEGKKVKSLVDAEMIAGWHKVLLTGIELETGMYIIYLETDKGLLTDKLMVR